VQVDFGALAFIFLGIVVDRKNDRDINHVIEMAFDALELVLHILPERGGEFQMVTADLEIHTQHSLDGVAGGSAGFAGRLTGRSTATVENSGLCDLDLAKLGNSAPFTDDFGQAVSARG
jgi:hypothetical protein